MAADVYTIEKEILSVPKKAESDTYHKEVNLIRWYGKEPKLDIRAWMDNREKKGKGVALTIREAKYIVDNIELIKEALDHADRSDI